jgi:transposase InsO family protein
MAWPFLGSRRMTAMLRARGLRINRKRVQRLMRQVGIAALGPKPNTSKPVLARPQDLSSSVAQHDDRSTEPGVGSRYHLFASWSRTQSYAVIEVASPILWMAHSKIASTS